MRVMTLTIEVRTPDTTGENEVTEALNSALDEKPENGLDWGDWLVGALVVTDVRHEPGHPLHDEDDDLTADEMRERGIDPVDRAACPHGGLLLTEDPDVYDCIEGCGDD